jgi:hypothetical protein
MFTMSEVRRDKKRLNTKTTVRHICSLKRKEQAEAE